MRAKRLLSGVRKCDGQTHRQTYGHPKLERRNPVLLLLLLCTSRSGYPPWILKRAGLESSGRRLISSIGKTKGIAFFFLDFFGFLGFLSKLLRLLLKVTKVTTGHQKMPKNWPKQHNKLFFCPKGKKSLGRRPKPSAGARSRPA